MLCSSLLSLSLSLSALGFSLSVCLPVSLCLSVRLSVCLSASVFVFISVSVCLSLSVSLCLCLSLSLCLCLSVCLCLSFSVSLSFSLFYNRARTFLAHCQLYNTSRVNLRPPFYPGFCMSLVVAMLQSMQRSDKDN